LIISKKNIKIFSSIKYTFWVQISCVNFLPDFRFKVSLYSDICEREKDDPNNQIEKFFLARQTFDLYSPRPGLISILWTRNLDTGGNHPNSGYIAEAYFLNPLRPVTLKDIFPDLAKSLPLLWAALGPKWAAMETNLDKVMPGFYEFPDSGGQISCLTPLPPLPKTLAEAKTLNDLGPTVLTKTGLFFYIEPYSCWGYAGGPCFVSFDKKELLALGAANLWD
jgi:hypothetical protein